VDTVLIKRDPVASDDPASIGGDGLVYIGRECFVDGARPDVEAAYPDYPYYYRAGWGYMLLTNFLPDGGNGTFTLHAVAYDKDGKKTSLGTKTITVDNATSVKPFGAIDTPNQGGTASGATFVNFGWALTPLPNTIATGSTAIDVFVDGVYQGKGTYGDYRSDIYANYPTLNNASSAGCYFFIDTTAFSNGTHTIGWNVTDNANNKEGIGSRFFQINNTGSRLSAPTKTVSQLGHIDDLKGYTRDTVPPRVRKGYTPKGNIAWKYGDSSNGLFEIEIKELQRVVINLNGKRKFKPSAVLKRRFKKRNRKLAKYKGFVQFGQKLRKLPIGSTLDQQKGIFYWQPGPGFVGEYNFFFINERDKTLKKVKVTIHPKF